VPHAGLVLLRQLADRTDLTAGLSQALPAQGAGLERCQVFADLACAIVGGAWVVSDFWVMGDQGEVFGQVASAPTVWRPLMASQPAGLTREQKHQLPAAPLESERDASVARCGESISALAVTVRQIDVPVGT
jgi:hypothetical protein